MITSDGWTVRRRQAGKREAGESNKVAPQVISCPWVQGQVFCFCGRWRIASALQAAEGREHFNDFFRSRGTRHAAPGRELIEKETKQ